MEGPFISVHVAFPCTGESLQTEDQETHWIVGEGGRDGLCICNNLRWAASAGAASAAAPSAAAATAAEAVAEAAGAVRSWACA